MKKVFVVQEGFGPFQEGLDECWGVRRTRITFQTMQEAERFGERWYERMVKVYQRTRPDWWKSYWVRTVEVK
jgi:hypothetical protein